MPRSIHGLWGLNSGPHSHMINVLLTEPSPQLQILLRNFGFLYFLSYNPPWDPCPAKGWREVPTHSALEAAVRRKPENKWQCFKCWRLIRSLSLASLVLQHKMSQKKQGEVSEPPGGLDFRGIGHAKELLSRVCDRQKSGMDGMWRTLPRH